MNTVHNRRVSGVLHHHCGAWCCPFPHHTHHTHGMDGMVVVVVGGRGGGSGWMSESEKGLVDKKPPTQHSESPRPAWWWWLTKGHTHWCACPWSLTCVVCVCGMRWVCVCGRRGERWQAPLWVCVWLVACVSEWHGVGTTQHALVSVVVHVACVCGSGASTKSRVCVCGGGGTRALVVVVGGMAWWLVAWEAHTAHTHTTTHHHGAHHQSRCVCVSGGHKGRGGGDHTPNHPCMRHACASRVCVSGGG